MGIWYEVEKTKEGIANFLDSNWGFHDFRIEYVNYIHGKDCVDVFLQDDSREDGVLLRLTWIHGMNTFVYRDYDAEWIYEASTFITEKGTFVWTDMDCIDSSETLDKMSEYGTWIECERIFWAIADGKGNVLEMPDDRIHQIWNVWGKDEEHYFELKEFTGDWNEILVPYYMRNK